MMKTMSRNLQNPKMPLSDKDRAALDEIFEKIEVEDIQVIEATGKHRSATPIPSWEEQGWVANSFIPNRCH